MFRYIAENIRYFSKFGVRTAILIVLHLLRYVNISFILEFVSGTTIYCGRSLAAKIITSEWHDLQFGHQQNFGDLLKQYTIGCLVNYDN